MANTDYRQNSVFQRPDAFPAAQTTASKHWKQIIEVKGQLLQQLQQKQQTDASDSITFPDNMDGNQLCIRTTLTTKSPKLKILLCTVAEGSSLP